MFLAQKLAISRTNILAQQMSVKLIFMYNCFFNFKSKNIFISTGFLVYLPEIAGRRSTDTKGVICLNDFELNSYEVEISIKKWKESSNGTLNKDTQFKIDRSWITEYMSMYNPILQNVWHSTT